MQIQNNNVHKQQHLEEVIIGRIRNEQLEPGDCIGSENQLAQDFNISRSTVRIVLDKLVSRGILFRRPGKGTYVSFPKNASIANVLISFGDKIADMGLPHHAKLITSEISTPERDVRDKLQLAEKDVVIKIERVRYVDNQPYAIHKTYLRHDLCKNILNQDIANISISHFISKILGITLAEAEQVIHARLASDSEKALLAFRESDQIALLCVDSVSFDEQKLPIRYTHAKYLADLTQLNISYKSALVNHDE
jgi:GntR family transcriptional regulator